MVGVKERERANGDSFPRGPIAERLGGPSNGGHAYSDVTVSCAQSHSPPRSVRTVTTRTTYSSMLTTRLLFPFFRRPVSRACNQPRQTTRPFRVTTVLTISSVSLGYRSVSSGSREFRYQRSSADCGRYDSTTFWREDCGSSA